MSLEGTHSVFVRRSPEVVFAALSDLPHAPRWVPGLLAVEPLSPGPVAVGSRFRQRLHLAGRDVVGELEVIELQPGRVFAHVGEAGPARLEGRFELAPEADGTRVTHHHRVHLRGLARAMAPLIGSRAEHGAQQALENLRARLEDGPVA